MKRLLVPSITLALLSFANTSRADILLSNPLIKTDGLCSPACGAGEYEWSYLAGLSQNEILSSLGDIPPPVTSGIGSIFFKDYFTIYDFLGYIPGSAEMPTGWGFESTMIGSTPSDILATDSPLIPNLTFYYDIGSPVIGPAVLGLFSARSIYGGQHIGEYGASATNNGTFPGTTDDKVTFTITPSAVPEPGSMLLLGSGLIGLAYRVSRAKKS